MDSVVARKLMEELMKCYGALEAAVSLAESVDDYGARTRLTRSILLAAAEIDEGGIGLIVSEHPELNPFSGARKRTF